MTIITNQMVVDSIESTIEMIKLNLRFYEMEIKTAENNTRYYESLSQSILNFKKDLEYWETELVSWRNKLK